VPLGAWRFKSSHPHSRFERRHERRPYLRAGGYRCSYVIPLTVYLYFELISAAALALWVIVRWPRLGPRSIFAAVAVVLVALVVGNFASTGVAVAVRLPGGIYAALLGLVLPVFLLIFLASGWLIRSLLAATGGGSGGTGHSVRA
jgi:hypothetical protein